MSSTPHRVITSTDELGEVVAALRDEPRYALDTEFHRERSYYPQVALLQLAWPGNLVLVDPLAVDIAPLAEVLDGLGWAVMHAAQQDLEVLDRACGTVPTHLFDTQVAAGFAGFSTPSLLALLDAVLDVQVPKGSRLTDWMARPLTDEQLRYAAGDVAHLLELHDELHRELDRTGRLAWVEAECRALADRSVRTVDPESAWLRLKDARSLRGKARGVAQSVAAWRERTAAATDQPVRFVLSDLGLLGIAQHPPGTEGELRRIRGIDDRHLRSGAGKEILAAVEAGLALPAGAVRAPVRDDIGRELRPAMTLISAWIGQLGRDVAIDPALLATRADIEAHLRGDASRLAEGWRADLVGEPIRQVLDGEAALAFDGEGRLALERRSKEPLVVDLARPTAPWVGGQRSAGRSSSA